MALINDRLLLLRSVDKPGMESDEFELHIDDRYRDGAALYFMRPQAAPVKVINDIHGDLVKLLRRTEPPRRVRAPVQVGAQLTVDVRVAKDGPPRNRC